MLKAFKNLRGMALPQGDFTERAFSMRYAKVGQRSFPRDH